MHFELYVSEQANPGCRQGKLSQQHMWLVKALRAIMPVCAVLQTRRRPRKPIVDAVVHACIRYARVAAPVATVFLLTSVTHHHALHDSRLTIRTRREAPKSVGLTHHLAFRKIPF